MSFARVGPEALDYKPCRYEGSAMTFRGPKARFEEGLVLCLGGSETFGKFVTDPFPDRLARRIGRPVVNMGAVNAGVDLILHDEAIKAALAKASAVVLQVPGAANLSNRFFTVHPRRNDRFVKASTMMRTIYREVDFTEFHFTRHMLSALKARSEDRFAVVVEELRAAWSARMGLLLSRIDVPVHLLWVSRRAPADGPPPGAELGDDPLFVDQAMLSALEPMVSSVTICCLPPDQRAPRERGMMHGRGEEQAARLMPGPSDHDRVSALLAARLS